MRCASGRTPIPSTRQVAYCSCTDEPRWARECLDKFELAPGLSLRQAADHLEIYKGGKAAHFRRLHTTTGIPFRDWAPSP